MSRHAGRSAARGHEDWTTGDALLYWQRHAVTERVVEQYRDSVDQPHRMWVADGLRELGGVVTVLEVGCGCGALLTYLDRAGYKAYGIDVNEAALLAADKAGCRVGLAISPDFFGRCGDRMFDAVVSSYALAYTDPLDLPFTLAEMLRVSRLGVVLAEPMAGAGVEPSSGSHGSYIEWRHDYLDALEEAVARLTPPPRLDMRRYARGPFENINGLVVGKLTWP